MTDLKLDGKITDETFFLVGHQVRIRIDPPEFLDDMKKFDAALRDRHFQTARIRIQAAKEKWGEDPEVLRAETLLSFLEGEEE